MFLGTKVRSVRGADKLTAIYQPIVGSLTPHNLVCLQDLLERFLFFFLKLHCICKLCIYIFSKLV
jgi:hypothetical protein